MKYENTGVTVMDTKDMIMNATRAKYDVFTFLYDLTEKSPTANIAVDEVPLDMLVKQKKIHHDSFTGSIWLAVSSVTNYDFKNKDDKTVHKEIPVEKSQGFKIIHLNRNMRNGSKILEDSFKLQEGTIEKATTQNWFKPKKSYNNINPMNMILPCKTSTYLKKKWKTRKKLCALILSTLILVTLMTTLLKQDLLRVE